MPRGIPPSEPGKLPNLLKDPCDDRPCKDQPCPPAQMLSMDVFYNKKGQPDLDILSDHLKLEGALSPQLLLDLIKKTVELFTNEPNLVKLNDPITVVGDIHGQYYDLVKLLEVGGAPGDTQYLFLGDYVDRGSFSVEVVSTLFACKLRYPKRVRMLRGNHECRQMTSFFNFREECEYKYDVGVYNAFMDAFDALPLAATINGKFLAVHGGLSPELANLKACNSINRFMEPPREGLLCDLLWSDPLEPKDDQPVKAKKGGPAFITNEVRGCSFFFTFDAAAKFLQKNSLLSIIRAHEAQLEGYKMHKTNAATGFPSVITIFSAPNYCDVYNNKAAILKFDNSTLNILQFNCSPHPYHLPNFMDIFTWSMPFVIEKVTEMLYYVLQPSNGRAADDEVLPSLPDALQEKVDRVYKARESLSADENKAVELATRLAQHVGSAEHKPGDAPQEDDVRDRMRKKVRTIARMARMFKTMRQENETVIRLKGVCPGSNLEAGLLLAGKERLNSEVEMFGHASGIDSRNEIRPDVGPVANAAIGKDFVEDGEEEEQKEDGEAKVEVVVSPVVKPA